MTNQNKFPPKPTRSGAVELPDNQLELVAGGAGAYAPIVIKKRIDKATP